MTGDLTKLSESIAHRLLDVVRAMNEIVKKLDAIEAEDARHRVEREAAARFYGRNLPHG
jgi:hypothetical protein